VTPATSLRILIDTNIFIAAEGDKRGTHIKSDLATKLYREATDLGHRLCLGAGVKDDFERIADPEHKQLRLRQLERYHVLKSIAVPEGFQARAGYPPGINAQSHVDMSLLLALERGAVQWLVTEDQRILPHAKALGLQDRVFSLRDATDVLARQRHRPVSIPAVDEVLGYELDRDDPIFDDFPDEYDIRAWLRDVVAPEDRPCLIMRSDGSPLDAVVILKEEKDETWGLDGKVLKVCTFKVAEHARGVKRGELLLWAIFEHARVNQYDTIFIEAYETKLEVTQLFEAFGFETVGSTHRPGEVVLAKRLEPSEADGELDPLAFNVLLGPGALRPDRFFVVPIIPLWHRSLFPVVNEAGQLSLYDNNLTDHGNAIRKAYVCRSPSNELSAGDTILFLRTRENQRVLVVGVVEQTLRSSSPTEILSFTGQRTVYTPDEIDSMCRKGNVLAIRFRLDRVLDTPLTVNDLIAHHVMTRSPQSVQRVRDQDAIAWLTDLLAG
jgi:hypothetical protein